MNELATRTPAQLELPVGARKLVEASVNENTRAYSSVPHRFMPPTLSRAVPGPPPTSPACSRRGAPISVKEVICKPVTNL